MCSPLRRNPMKDAYLNVRRCVAKRLKLSVREDVRMSGFSLEQAKTDRRTPFCRMIANRDSPPQHILFFLLSAGPYGRAGILVVALHLQFHSVVVVLLYLMKLIFDVKIHKHLMYLVIQNQLLQKMVFVLKSTYVVVTNSNR